MSRPPVEIRDSDFIFLRRFCLKAIGIDFDEAKAYLLRDRLAVLTEDLGITSISELCWALRREPEGAIAKQVINAVTTHESSFFRDLPLFAYLRHDYLPQLISTKLKDKKALRIWSAACSFGQEPWSLVFLLHEFPQVAHLQIDLLCTDISEICLEATAAGRFSAENVGTLEAAKLRQFLAQDKAGYEVRPEYNKWVKTRFCNLAQPASLLAAAGDQPWDLIFCRNVLIYFNADKKDEIVKSFAHCTALGGMHCYGAGEGFLTLPQGFKRATDLSYVFLRTAPSLP